MVLESFLSRLSLLHVILIREDFRWLGTFVLSRYADEIVQSILNVPDFFNHLLKDGFHLKVLDFIDLLLQC